MSMIEGGTKVAASTVDALKSQPLALALIVINALFLASAIWLFHEVAAATVSEREHRNKMFDQLATECGDRIRQDIADVQRMLDQLRGDLRAPPKPPELKP